MPRLPNWRYMSLRTKRLILLPVIAFAGLSLIRAYTPIIILKGVKKNNQNKTYFKDALNNLGFDLGNPALNND